MAEGGLTLEYTPTWVVAVVCTVIVAISLAVERLLHFTGQYLKRKNQKPLYEALEKIKEELMLLGFISLLLTVTQTAIGKICMPKTWGDHWLPCKLSSEPTTTSHFQIFFNTGGVHRRLLSSDTSSYCEEKGKIPLLSTTALHHLHIFIFVLAVVHVTFSALTIIFGGAKIRVWKHWENSIEKMVNDPEQAASSEYIHVQEHDFIRDRFMGIGKRSFLLSWLHAFLKQFYGSVTKSDYTTLRLGFIKTHCKGILKFNFHKYMIRALEDDFKRVVGISWYLWVFVVVFLLLNVYGWHAYFYLAFVPIVLLLAVGAKLEHVITQLAHEVAEKHSAVKRELVITPSDEHFWFGKPEFVLFLIHVILFQNSFELAVFFWILVQYGFRSCIMGQIGYIIPRLVIGLIVQLLCSYSTLPLYAIVTQMGTSFKKAIFEEDIQKGLVGWAQKARQKKHTRKDANGSSQADPTQCMASIMEIPLVRVEPKNSSTEESKSENIEPANATDRHH